ncbi:MAG: hypothetical protein A2017_06640 [Lentisphaerae bacterium GWF2_44_16]|nr:MAG: hypothetical protein A2017_06640 [Lentisphaerae bacterium GWF2_44_16]
MSFNVNYGNPYLPSVGEGVFDAAKKATTYSRLVQNAQLQIAADNLEIERAKMHLSVGQAKVEQAYRQRVFQENQAERQKSEKLARDKMEQDRIIDEKKIAAAESKQTWEKSKDIEAQKNARAYVGYGKQDRENTLRKEKEAKELQVRNDLNKIAQDGGIPYKEGEAAPAGRVLHVAADNSKWYVTPESEKKFAETKRIAEMQGDVAVKKAGEIEEKKYALKTEKEDQELDKQGYPKEKRAAVNQIRERIKYDVARKESLEKSIDKYDERMRTVGQLYIMEKQRNRKAVEPEDVKLYREKIASLEKEINTVDSRISKYNESLDNIVTPGLIEARRYTLSKLQNDKLNGVENEDYEILHDYLNDTDPEIRKKGIEAFKKLMVKTNNERKGLTLK